MSFPHQAVLQFSADTHWFPRIQPHSYTTWSWGRPQLRGWGPETASTSYAHHKSRPPTLLNHRLFPQAPPWGRQCARTNISRTQRNTSARLLAYPWDTTRERPRGRGAQGKGVGRAVQLRPLWGHPLSSTWRAPGPGNCRDPLVRVSGASSTWVQVMKSMLTGSLPPSLSPGKGVHGWGWASSPPITGNEPALLIWITKDTSLTQITQEILRVKRALCQELATKTRVMCFLFYHNICRY